MVDVTDSASVYKWLLSTARHKAAGDGCSPDTCGPGKPLPVQVWRHKSGKFSDLPVWQLCRPPWKKGEYDIVKKFNCFFVCQNRHFHHCAVGHCDCLETNMVIENSNGNKCCITSGRVVEVTTEYDWREKKKGQFAPRKGRNIGSGASSSMVYMNSMQANTLLPHTDTGNGEVMKDFGRYHNTIDLKMMQTASRVVIDCLFSRMRQEFYMNARRAKKQSIETKAQQFIKKNRRENKITFVADLNRIGIDQGWFSNLSYETVVKAQDPQACTQTVAPFLVALYKKINALSPNQPGFKSFLSFAIAALFCTIRGVNLHSVQLIPQYSNMRYLLPEPYQVECLSRSLWNFYADGSPSQQNFLTRTQNQIRAAFNNYIKTKNEALCFVRDLETRTVLLRQQYGDVVEASMFY